MEQYLITNENGARILYLIWDGKATPEDVLRRYHRRYNEHFAEPREAYLAWLSDWDAEWLRDGRMTIDRHAGSGTTVEMIDLKRLEAEGYWFCAKHGLLDERLNTLWGRAICACRNNKDAEAREVKETAP